MLKDMGKSIKGATVVSSGSGNVSIYATQKVQELGGNLRYDADFTGGARFILSLPAASSA